MPDVSVVMPIRPKCETLEKALSSLLRQSFENWKLIALLDRDEGDNRSTLTALIPSEKLSIIEVDITTTDFPSILNLGISACTTEFVARQDDDDVSVESRLLDQLSMFSQDPTIDLVSGWARAVYPNGENAYWIKPPLHGDQLSSCLIAKNVFAHSSVTFRVSAFNEAGGYKSHEKVCEDYGLWLRMTGRFNMLALQKEVVSYLVNPNGMSRSSISSVALLSLRSEKWKAGRRIGMPPVKILVLIAIWEMKQRISQLRNQRTLR